MRTASVHPIGSNTLKNKQKKLLQAVWLYWNKQLQCCYSVKHWDGFHFEMKNFQGHTRTLSVTQKPWMSPRDEEGVKSSEKEFLATVSYFYSRKQTQMFILFLIVVRSKLSSLLVLKWPRWFQKDSKERSWNLTLLFPPSKDFKEHKLESEENWIRSLSLFFLFFLLTEAQPTPDIYQGEVMDMLKEFTKNRNHEQRLDAPSLEYLEKESQWGPWPFRLSQRLILGGALGEMSDQKDPSDVSCVSPATHSGVCKMFRTLLPSCTIHLCMKYSCRKSLFPLFPLL